MGTDFPPADVTVGDADSGEEKTQVVVDFRDGADGGTRILTGGPLFDGDGGRQPLDGFHIRFVHLADKLPGISGKRFHISSLAFGVNRVKGQGGFSGTTDPGDYDQLVPGDVETDVFQVMLRGTLDADKT
ncbi:MAG: hypothetical protein A4E66_02534 [Syntrophus sp. PtaB.Bin001]|nr:MAG: hypothetical protein A4E66_02534 [Syntrophus sp. PtaB.Bin001]